MKTSLLLLTALTLSVSVSAAEVRLNGATTTVNALINPNKTAVESATGFTLKVVGTNTGKGLAALIAGQCDASLTSEPLDVAMVAAKFAGLELKAGDFQIHEIVQDHGVFVVHPSNPVSTLSRAQVKDILAGRITNWSAVGGPDLPIIVFTDPVGAGTRTLVQLRALDGEDYGPRTQVIENIRLVAGRIAELKGGFGFVGASFVDAKVKPIDSDRITRPLGFITKGAPTADVQRVIEAFKTVRK